MIAYPFNVILYSLLFLWALSLMIRLPRLFEFRNPLESARIVGELLIVFGINYGRRCDWALQRHLVLVIGGVVILILSLVPPILTKRRAGRYLRGLLDGAQPCGNPIASVLTHQAFESLAGAVEEDRLVKYVACAPMNSGSRFCSLEDWQDVLADHALTDGADVPMSFLLLPRRARLRKDAGTTDSLVRPIPANPLNCLLIRRSRDDRILVAPASTSKFCESVMSRVAGVRNSEL